MAVKIEKGGWALIFLVGLGLVGYSLQKYGVLNFRSVLGSRSDTSPSEPLDTSKPLPVAATSDASCDRVRTAVHAGGPRSRLGRGRTGGTGAVAGDHREGAGRGGGGHWGGGGRGGPPNP